MCVCVRACLYASVHARVCMRALVCVCVCVCAMVCVCGRGGGSLYRGTLKLWALSYVVISSRISTPELLHFSIRNFQEPQKGLGMAWGGGGGTCHVCYVSSFINNTESSRVGVGT